MSINEISKIRTKETLIEFINHGNRAKYIFFWGHRQHKSEVSKSCFSQWYESPFEFNQIVYPTAEHYMMAEKARLFEDRESLRQIIAAKNPGEAKRLGRGIQGFDDSHWVEHRLQIVIEGNLAKFGQHPALKEYLINTQNRVLVEASPQDRIWGIGLAVDHPAAENPNLWKGLNLLGFALMEVRERLINVKTQ